MNAGGNVAKVKYPVCPGIVGGGAVVIYFFPSLLPSFSFESSVFCNFN